MVNFKSEIGLCSLEFLSATHNFGFDIMVHNTRNSNLNKKLKRKVEMTIPLQKDAAQHIKGRLLFPTFFPSTL